MADSFLLGQHAAQLTALSDRCLNIETTVSSMDSKLDAIALTLAERRGERKTIAVLATFAGGVGSLLVTVFLKVFVG